MYQLFLKENREFLYERLSPLIIAFVISIGYIIIGIHDPFPGHSVDFLVAGQAAGVSMVIFGFNKILTFISAFIPAIIGSLDEFYNFLPGPGVKDIIDVYCYFGGALLVYLLYQLVSRNMKYAIAWYNSKSEKERAKLVVTGEIVVFSIVIVIIIVAVFRIIFITKV